jgi:ribose transport system substrate-binding protein
MRSSIALAAALAAFAAPAAGAAPSAPPAPSRLAWYAAAPHPYFDAVRLGVEAFEKDYGLSIQKRVGADWSMDSESAGVRALAADGFDLLAIYPSDASAANGLYEEIVAGGGKVVNLGAATFEPTPASLAVMTDVKAAAMKAADFLVGKMGRKGTLIDVLEVLEDANTKLRKEGIDEVLRKYPSVRVIEIAGVESERQAAERIEAAVAGEGGSVGGILCTGFVPTVALAGFLEAYESKAKKHIAAVGIEDDPMILDAVAKGYLDATVAENYFGHGYLSLLALKLLSEGYRPAAGAYRIDSGVVLVTKANAATYKADLAKLTQQIKGSLARKYLKK